MKAYNNKAILNNLINAMKSVQENGDLKILESSAKDIVNELEELQQTILSLEAAVHKLENNARTGAAI
jgi:hypothetical protein